MVFKNRHEAGEALAGALASYKNNTQVITYALPRGGVIIGDVVSSFLSCPLELIITRKIGHPYDSEFAIAAIAENGHVILEQRDISDIDKTWFQEKILEQKKEIKRRKQEYVGDRKIVSAKDKIAILVDDGIATGLTMKVAVKEIMLQNPKKIIVAVPVASGASVGELKKLCDDVVVLEVDTTGVFAIGRFYENFAQVTDEQVKEIMQAHIL